MRATSLVLVLGLLVSPVAAPAQQEDIARTINAQLQAFTHRDAEKAFSYASPAIHGMFGTAENFAAMVQNGYPMVWSPRSAEMLDLRSVAGSLWQRVHVTDAQGHGWLLDYQMVQTPDGWRINAVDLLPGTDLGA